MSSLPVLRAGFRKRVCHSSSQTQRARGRCWARDLQILGDGLGVGRFPVLDTPYEDESPPSPPERGPSALQAAHSMVGRMLSDARTSTPPSSKRLRSRSTAVPIPGRWRTESGGTGSSSGIATKHRPRPRRQPYRRPTRPRLELTCANGSEPTVRAHSASQAAHQPARPVRVAATPRFDGVNERGKQRQSGATVPSRAPLLRGYGEQWHRVELQAGAQAPLPRQHTVETAIVLASLPGSG